MQKTTQLTITGFTDSNFQEIVGRPFIGTIDSDSSVLSDTLKFELLLEAPGGAQAAATEIERTLTAINNILYRYDGMMQTPNYMMVEWGEAFSFKGTIKSFDVTYTLAREEGMPVRVRIALAYVPVRKRVLFAN